jgi:predicted transcriptional regulator
VETKVLQLVKVIGEEAVIFETFLELLNRQQEALVCNDMDSLQAVTLEQEKLAVRTAQVEQQRIELVRSLSQEFNRDQADINLTELTKLVSEPESNQIRTLQATLLGLHQQISTIKSRNDFLIKKSMEYIDNTLSYLAATGEKKVTYDAENGKPSGRTRLSVVDRRA